MELRCPTVNRPHYECVVYNDKITNAVQSLQQTIDMVTELRGLIAPIERSAYCSLDVGDTVDSAYHDTCQYKAASFNGIPRSFDFLDVVRLRDTRANVPLRNAVAADNIIFESKVSLYGDWTTRTDGRGRLVVRNYIPSDQEDSERGYNLGVESLLTINHRLDFNGADGTAPHVFDAVVQIVCREHDVSSDDSLRMQVLIRELGLMDGNATI